MLPIKIKDPKSGALIFNLTPEETRIIKLEKQMKELTENVDKLLKKGGE